MVPLSGRQNFFQKYRVKRDGPVFFKSEAARLGIKMKKQYQNKNIPRKPLPRAWRAAFERLDTALRENTGSSNARKIAALRKVCFADVEAFEASGELVIPKWEP